MKVNVKEAKCLGIILFVVSVLSGVLAVTRGHSEKAELKNNTLNEKLKSILGDRYKKTDMGTIYFAGPNKTIDCA